MTYIYYIIELSIYLKVRKSHYNAPPNLEKRLLICKLFQFIAK